MSLKEQFDELSLPRLKCKTCIWYVELNAEDKAFFDSHATDIEMKKLWSACTADGLVTSLSSFRSHVANHHTGATEDKSRLP